MIELGAVAEEPAPEVPHGGSRVIPSGGPAPHRQPYTPADIHRFSQPRRPGLEWINPGLLAIVAAGFLTTLGIGAIDTVDAALARRQGTFAAVALVAALVVMLIPPRLARDMAWWLYAASVLLLIFVLIPWVPEWLVRPRNGSRRWISIGLFDFQPSELSKLAFVLALAAWLRTREHHRRLLGLLVPFAVALLPMALILIEPDLGTALLFLPTLLIMLLAAGSRKRHIAAVVLLGALSAPLAYSLLEPYQRDRIDAIMAHWKGDPRLEQGIGFQGKRAVTLVGAGGLFGVGEEHAQALIRHNALPEEHNDMVFAVICCRWGLMGGAMVWGLFLIYAIGGLWLAAILREPFSRLVAVGCVTTILLQAIVNTGMTIGLLPITGMTLPFVSYGGSSLVAAWLMTGFLYGMALRREPWLMRQTIDLDGQGRSVEVAPAGPAFTRSGGGGP
jgi:cell division protein FtsW (lipid II flippase)